MSAIAVATSHALPLTLGGTALDEVTDVMFDVVIQRGDSAQNLAGYAAAACACPDRILDLTAIARHAPASVDNPRRTFKNMLTSDHIDDAKVVEALIASALAGDVR